MFKLHVQFSGAAFHHSLSVLPWRHSLGCTSVFLYTLLAAGVLRERFTIELDKQSR